MTNIVTIGLGSTPSGVILLGYHWGGVAPEPEAASPQGGDDAIAAAAVWFRQKKRTEAERSRRLAELNAAIAEAEQSGADPNDAIAPVVEILEREYRLSLPSMDDLDAALSLLGRIDQQIAALHARRLQDAAAVLLLMEI